MDKFSLIGWLLVLVAAVSIEAAPEFQHLYLGYVSPYEFLQGHNEGYRPKRSAMDYGHHSTMDHKAMPYGHSFGYNPMMYPYKMFSLPSMHFPAMPQFPAMHFPAMPKFNFPYNNFPSMHSGDHYNAGYKPYQPVAKADPAPYHPFGDHFMKMMGFHGNHANTYNNNNHAAAYNNNNNHANAYGSNTNNHHANNYNSPKGKNYEMSYSKSYSMNMDYANGKGHMVTKDSSYMNDNGKVYQHNNPEQHYTAHGNGKFVPDNSYNQH